MRMTYSIIKMQVFINQHIMRQKERWVQDTRGEFGIGSIIGVAIGIIVAAFVLVPGARSFASSVLTSMDTWWTNSISGTLFPVE